MKKNDKNHQINFLANDDLQIKKIANGLTKAIKKFFEVAGKKKAVVGLSGGVDSSVVATLAVQALGAKNVTGYLMPHKDFSSEEHLRDAQELAKFLKIKTEEIEISPFCQEFFNLDFQKNMTKGNIMARTRMIILYAFANEFDALVLGTGNKTELLTGYFTKWGDGAVDVEVLGNVYKTEVFTLARHFSLPQNIYSKAPSAELIANQTDEEEMGITYQRLDEILIKMENTCCFSPETEDEKKVMRMVQASYHKVTMPEALNYNI